MFNSYGLSHLCNKCIYTFSYVMSSYKQKFIVFSFHFPPFHFCHCTLINTTAKASVLIQYKSTCNFHSRSPKWEVVAHGKATMFNGIIRTYLGKNR